MQNQKTLKTTRKKRIKISTTTNLYIINYKQAIHIFSVESGNTEAQNSFSNIKSYAKQCTFGLLTSDIAESSLFFVITQTS